MKLLLLAFLGASIGSFLGLVIDRFPERSLLFPASHCNACKKPLKVWDLIPIFSQLSTKSKCRYCKAKIPYWYAGLESTTALLVVLFSYQMLSLLELVVILCGLVLTIYDIKHQEYPVMVWLAFTFFALILSQLHLVFCGLLFLAYLTERFELKIGSGDFLYLASLSLLFDLSQVLWIIQLSALFGIGIFLLFRSRTLPYVPFLFLASLLVFIWG